MFKVLIDLVLWRKIGNSPKYISGIINISEEVGKVFPPKLVREKHLIILF